MATVVERAIRAAKLDVQLYEEVEHDAGALGQAMTVVVVVALASGLGAVGAGLRGIIAGILGSLIGWFLWAALTWAIGTKVLPEPDTKADIGQMLRTTGFSAAPGVLNVFQFIPVLGALVALVAAGWQLAAMVVAVRQTLDYTSTGRAVGVCLLGFVVYVVLFMIIAGVAYGPRGV